MSHQAAIREEELKNRVAAMFFGKYDCARIIGNIDFCVLPKRRDPRQMMFIPERRFSGRRRRTTRRTSIGCLRS